MSYDWNHNGEHDTFDDYEGWFGFLFLCLKDKGVSVMNEKLYYITDTYDTYYALNAANKLVVVSKQEMASQFTLAKANQVIQSVIKPMQRYQYILKEVSTSESDDNQVELNDHEYRTTRFVRQWWIDRKNEKCVETNERAGL